MDQADMKPQSIISYLKKCEGEEAASFYEPYTPCRQGCDKVGGVRKKKNEKGK